MMTIRTCACYAICRCFKFVSDGLKLIPAKYCFFLLAKGMVG